MTDLNSKKICRKNNNTGQFCYNWGGGILVFGAVLLCIALIYLVSADSTFFPPTPDNATSTTNTSIQINTSISMSNLSSAIYNWNGTNYTLFDNSLVLMYNFDNNSAIGENLTYVVDNSKYENNGTINGGNWASLGKFNGGYNFTGNNRVLVPYNSSLYSPNLTISFWINPNKLTYSSNGYVIGMYDTANNKRVWGIFAYTTGSNFAIITSSDGVGNGYNISSKQLQSGWHKLDFTTNNNGTWFFYYDGVFYQSYTLPIFANRNSFITIGGLDASNYFNGTVDEVRIWNRSLTGLEIWEQYASNLQKYNSTQWYLYINQSKNSTTGLDLGTYTYQVFAFDSLGNSNFTDQRTINIVESDTIYPEFSDYYDNNASLLDNGTGLFNVTVTNTNGTVYLNIDGHSILATNLTNNVYNASYNFGSAGTYLYNWTAYGNGSFNNLNISNNRNYIVNGTLPLPISIISPINNNNYSYSLINLNVSSTSNIISNWWYYFNGTQNPVIYAIGDSITAGHNHYDPDPTHYAGTDPINSSYEYWLDYYMNSNISAINSSNWSIYNKGIGGQTCAQIISRWNTDTANNSIVIILCGANGGQANVLTTEDNWQTIYNLSQAKNQTLIWGELTPSSTSSCLNPTNMSILNNWLENWTNSTNQKLVKWHNSLTNGTYGCINTSLIEDNIHPNVEGYKKMAYVLWQQGFSETVYSQNKNITFTPNISLSFPNGNINLIVYVNDTAGTINSTTVNFLVDTTNPNATLLSPSNNSYNNTNQNFTANLTDNLGIKNATLYIWNNTGQVNQTTFTNFASGTLQSIVGIVVTLVDNTYNWWYQIWDWAGNTYTTQNNTITIDTTYPQFINNLTSIANGSEYSNNNYQFNITIANTNGTAGIEFNGTNYTLSNVSSSFYWSVNSLGSGTYSYYYWAYGNGTINNFNISQTYSYSIIQNTSLVLGLTATTSIIYGTATNFVGSNCPSQLTCSLNITNGIFAAGTISANYSTPGNANYSATSTIFVVTINQANSSVYTYLNNSRSNITIMNGTSIWLNATRQAGEGIINLYNNGTLINSGSSPLSNLTNFTTLGLFNITAIYPATQNYSASSETWWVNVTNITSTPAPYCGDGTCNNGETCSTCAGDCGQCQSSGGGGGFYVRSFWDSTYANDYAELKNLPPVLYSLEERQRVLILVDSEQHSVGVTDINEDKVTINVSSNNSKQAILGPGESAKFEINNDSYYDVKVLLNNIYKILGTNKANLTITYIHEKMPDNETALVIQNSNNNSIINISNNNSDKCGIGQGKNLGVCIKNIFGNPFLLFVAFLVIFIIWAVYTESKKKKY